MINESVSEKVSETRPLQCPKCGHERVWKHHKHPVHGKKVQLWICPECGHIWHIGAKRRTVEVESP